MACIVRGEPKKVLNTGLKSVREKMDAVAANTRAQVDREKRAKEALSEANLREERALSKKRKILDEISKAEQDMEKIETQVSYCKERLYFANQRYDENAYMKVFLEKNKVDVGSMECSVEQYREKTKSTVQAIAKMQKTIENKEREILTQEKRELTARDRMSRIQEKLRAVERAGQGFSQNYTPINEKQYLEKLEEMKEKIAKAVVRRKKAEKKADALEKNIVEKEKQIAVVKKRNAELTQTTNELRGSRV
ncbi:unnamed protein product [Porites lobata]|uniref:Uncharacterized protein n=1 Tax=Porites lobata TaxID=104759 RepID=A0ABN8NYV7_9CNID|nr:unnamed protein product [Porites lobata]